MRCARARFCLSFPMKREKCEQRHDSVFNLQPHLAWPFFFYAICTPHVHAQIRQMRQVPYLEEAPHQGSKKQILFSFCVSFSASSMKREKCERHGFQNADVTWQCVFFSSKHSYRAAGCDRSSRMSSIRQQGSVHPDIR